MTGQACDPDVVDEVLAAELRAYAQALAELSDSRLPFRGPNRTTCRTALPGKTIKLPTGKQLHRLHVHVRAEPTHDDGEVVRRASCSAKGLELLLHKLQEGILAEDGLSLLEELRLVSAATPLSNEEQVIDAPVAHANVNLRREIVLGVCFLKHAKGRHLRVAQVSLHVRVVDAPGKVFAVPSVSHQKVPPVRHDGCCSCVLAAREPTASGHHCILQQLASNKLVVRAGLRVLQDAS
mmetsp:Transcript_36146/g.114940  ORF Transcript_36146/g.114940 Transcript_36146/m.114940 type:complete len:237 (-) Transcript_36146:439-1149(-)